MSIERPWLLDPDWIEAEREHVAAGWEWLWEQRRQEQWEEDLWRQYEHEVGLEWTDDGLVQAVDLDFDEWLARREVAYQCWTNLDAESVRSYEPGDRLMKGWADVLRPGSADLEATAELVFARHNRDDRPDAALCPSMSVGDVVMFGQVALSLQPDGFCRVDVDTGDLITDRLWRQVLDEATPSTAHTILDGWARQATGPSPDTGPELDMGPQ